MKCVILDDEELARAGLEDHLRNIPFLEITGSCATVAEAQALLLQEEVHLLFLDIEMPFMNGLHFIESLKNPPLTILVTAWADHALEGYRLGVIDYLLKPVLPSRLMQAVNKARDYFQWQQKTQQPAVSDHIFIRHNQVYEKVKLAEIIYIEGMQNYVVVHTMAKKMMVHLTFKAVEQSLPANDFLRIHRSYLINIHHITAVENNMVHIGGIKIVVAPSQRAAFMEQVVYRNLLSR